MALDFANAGQLPNPPNQYSPEHIRQMIRVIELYFSQLDSQMPNHAEKYTAKQFVGGDFFGGRFFGEGVYLNEEFQRFASFVDQSAAAVDVASIVSFAVVGFAKTITLVAPGKLHVTIPGPYKITYYLGFGSGVTAGAVNVWLRVNGVDRPNSNAQFSVPANSAVMATFSYEPTLASGDYAEIAWAPSNTGILLKSKPAFAGAPGVAPPIPATPSAVVNMELLQANMPAVVAAAADPFVPAFMGLRGAIRRPIHPRRV